MPIIRPTATEDINAWCLRHGVTIGIECRDEDTSVHGNVLASGDDAEDRKAEQWVLDQLNAGNPWAWCTVRVFAKHKASHLERDVYLGCCSYESAAAFMADGYYADLCYEVCDALAVEADRLRQALA